MTHSIPPTNKKRKCIKVKNLKAIGSITAIKRLNNSVWGNPRFELELYFPSWGKFVFAKTASDAAAGYTIHSGIKNKPVEVTCHYTAKGNCIITYIKEMEA